MLLPEACFDLVGSIRESASLMVLVDILYVVLPAFAGAAGWPGGTGPERPHARPDRPAARRPSGGGLMTWREVAFWPDRSCVCWGLGYLVWGRAVVQMRLKLVR
ncbi:hypothetical protein GCM10022224_071470 [Nonomuraea antimicrobica]|uniref:Uncharacterized protein n=1 Tax=Nonomuraea antimicrobica TaxID=561173 RepID=A0ABP7CUE8_9ACTN